jgi:hypothetical protein
MSRQLIAGEPQRPRQPRLVAVGPTATPVVVAGKTTYPTVAAAVAAMQGMVADLGELHRQVIEIDERTMRLQGRLADPALFDHPKRGDAERRYEDLVRDRAELEARMQAQMLVIGDIYLALPAEVRSGIPYPPVTTRYQMRAWLESCLAVGWLPQDEVPF